MEKPIFLDLNNSENVKFFDKQIKNGAVAVDTYKDQLEELAEISDPTLLAEKFEKGKKPQIPDVKKEDGIWVYFPWRNTLVHVLNKEDFRKVRLSRNLNLISPEDQKTFTEKRIAIAGLNVGHPGAICIALEGGSENIKITDLDILSLSNLNRFRAGVCELGLNKADLTARQIYEIDPYYDIDSLGTGIGPQNIDSFLLEPRIDLLIEEMDNMPLKIKIREKAKEHKIPVLMVTGNAAGLIIDVERFDLDNSKPLLNGFLPESVQKEVFEIKPGISKFNELIKLLKDFMGDRYLHKDLIASFGEVGKSLAGIPQLSEASFLRGAMLCYFARMILTQGDKIKSGRYSFHPETLESIRS